MKSPHSKTTKGYSFRNLSLISSKDLLSSVGSTKGIRLLVEEGEVVPLAYGIYRGKDAKEPTFRQVVEFRYIGDDKDPFGFWAGPSFRELLHGRDPALLTEPEIITRKSTSGRKRTVLIGHRLTLRAPWATVEKKSLPANAFLSYLVLGDMDALRDEIPLLRNYVRRNQIGADEISSLSPLFPAKASRRLVELGLHKVLWRG